MQRFFAAILGASVLMMLFGGILGPRLASGLEPGRAIMLGLAFVLPYAALLVAVAWLGKRAVARVREEEKRRHPEAYAGPREGAFGPLLEYRSPVRLLGLPLVHVRLSTPPGEPVLPAVGWVAIGDRAIGVLFAFGGLAVGAISFGGLALGLLTLGGIAAGLFAMGGIVVGWTAMGGVAVGVVAAGGNAFGWTAADGGVIAVARDFARGTHAAARHVNDDAARLFFARHPWTNTDEPSGRLLLNLAYLPILLVVLPRWLLAGRRQSR
jgi:MFS family permease